MRRVDGHRAHHIERDQRDREKHRNGDRDLSQAELKPSAQGGNHFENPVTLHLMPAVVRGMLA